MANNEVYTQYIFKDGQFRKVAGSGGSEPAATKLQDIKIKDVKFSGFAGVGSYGDLIENNASDYSICFETTPIDDDFEQGIKNGKAIIRFDYPIKHHNSRERKSGNGHKGFVRNLYIKDSEDSSVVKPSGFKDELLDSFLFLDVSDIKINEQGEKYIYKEISAFDFCNKFATLVVPGEMDVDTGNYTTSVKKKFEVVDITFPSSDNFIPYYKGEMPYWIVKGGQVGMQHAQRSMKNYDLRFNYYEPHSHFIPTDELGKPPLFSVTNKTNRIFFPMYARANMAKSVETGSFDYYLQVNDGYFYVNMTTFTPKGKRKSNNYVDSSFGIGEAFNFNAEQFTSPQDTKSCSLDTVSSFQQRFVNSAYLRPRLAILKDDYLTIGSVIEEIGHSMWKKTYSQSEQQIRLTLNGVHSWVDENDDGYLMASFTSQITKLK